MKILSKYNALFFDFDGVIADSVEVKTGAFALMFEKFGSKIQSEVIEHHRSNGGVTRKDKLFYYYQKYLGKSLKQEELDGLCSQFSDLVVDNVVAAPEIPGAEKFLETCFNRGIQCFIVSATPDEEIREIVKRRGINIYFKEILGSGRSKTENVNYLIDKYGLKPQQCLFFGDAPGDYRAATETGVDFIGIVPDANAPLLQTAPDIKWYGNFEDLFDI